VAEPLVLSNGKVAALHTVQPPDALARGEWRVVIPGGPTFHIFAEGRGLAGRDLTEFKKRVSRAVDRQKPSAIESAIRRCVDRELVRLPAKRPGQVYNVTLTDDDWADA
jgi:hypothetical protein